MINPLTHEELVNLQTFSDHCAVTGEFNIEGFTESEAYIVEKYFPQKGRILDLGCGTGRTTLPFKQKGFEVVGIDLSKEMIAFARQKHTCIDFRVMNASNLEFDNTSFDSVLFSFNGIDYIHPFEKRERCLHEVWRVLKKNGIFAFSSHNALCLPQTRFLTSLFVRNLLSLRLFSKYRLEYTPTGRLITYHGFPFFEKLKLEKTGFEVLEIFGKIHKKFFSICFLELTPHYIAKKL